MTFRNEPFSLRYRVIRFLLLIPALLAVPPAFGQFSRTNVGFSAVERPAAAWGDYDGDSDLDLVIAGEAHGDKLTTLYRRNDGGTFSAVATPLSQRPRRISIPADARS